MPRPMSTISSGARKVAVGVGRSWKRLPPVPQPNRWLRVSTCYRTAGRGDEARPGGEAVDPSSERVNVRVRMWKEAEGLVLL